MPGRHASPRFCDACANVRPVTERADQEVAKVVVLPVWMYWEGPCPEWIAACQRTVFDHAQDVRMLNAAEFDRVWDIDRDIDLSGLYVAHRADFIRAFLLARFGGLWVDSDCVVVKPLKPVLDLLETYDFLGYSQGHGFVTNNFFGSCPGSSIAASYYERVCRALRSQGNLEWLEVGAYALTDALRETRQNWYQMPPELVEPVSVHNPKTFLVVDSSENHDQNFNSRSICYMLSNHVVGKYVYAHPEANLLAEGTFFRYLLARSTQTSITLTPAADPDPTSNTAQASTGTAVREALDGKLYKIVTICPHGSVLRSAGPEDGWKICQVKNKNEDDAEQQWRLIKVGDGGEKKFTATGEITFTDRYQIENVANGRVLGVGGKSREGKAGIFACINEGGEHGQWWLVPTGDEDAVIIMNVYSGKVIDIFGANPHDDAEIVQMPCHASLCQQKWRLMATASG